MSEETAEAGSPLMSALFDAAEESPTETISPPETRSLGEILRQAEEGTLPTPESEPPPPQEPPQPQIAVSKREIDLAPPAQQPVPQAAPPPAPASPPPAPVVDPYAGLLPEQKERLRLARVGEEMYKANPGGTPQEYNNLHSRYLEYYQKEAAYAADNVDSGNMEWDEEYKQIKEKYDPGLSDTLLRRLEGDEIKLQVGRELQATKQEVAALKHQVHQQKALPKVKAAVSKYCDDNYNNSVPQDVQDEITKVGKEEYAKTHPFEYGIIENTLKTANGHVAEFEQVNGGLVKYDPKRHSTLVGRIESMGQAYKKSARSRDGKTFVTRDEFAKIPESQRGSHYTWSADEVKKAFMVSAKGQINNKLGNLREKMKAYEGNGVTPKSPPRQEIRATPKTATPRTPQPSTPSVPVEGKASTLEAMLLG